jgi:hypothetical protein
MEDPHEAPWNQTGVGAVDLVVILTCCMLDDCTAVQMDDKEAEAWQ